MTAAPRLLLLLIAFNGLLAVGAGAFGAHAAADPPVRDWLRTAAAYQLPHAAAALAVLALWPGRRTVAWLFAAGALVFGVSLDLLALTGARAWGAVTPIGGLLLLAGWAVLGWAALRGSSASERQRLTPS